MTVDLKTLEKEGYLEITCYGYYHRNTMVDAIDRALDIGEEKGAKVIVMDINNIIVDGKPPDTTDRYYLGEKVAKIQINRQKRIFLAIVGKEPLIDPGRFGETVAINRGAYGKVFDGMEKALNWIQDRF